MELHIHTATIQGGTGKIGGTYIVANEMSLIPTIFPGRHGNGKGLQHQIHQYGSGVFTSTQI